MAVLTFLYLAGLVLIYSGLAAQPSAMAVGLILAGSGLEVGLVWSLS